MTTATMKRIGAQQLAALAEQLDTVDRHLLELIDVHHYATTRQLAGLVNLGHAYASARSALRQTARRLSRHRSLGLVDHLARRIGGVRAGSSGFVWHLTEPGHRLLHPGSGRRRHSEPSLTFLNHTVAITEARLVIQQTLEQTGGELLLLHTEPAC